MAVVEIITLPPRYKKNMKTKKDKVLTLLSRKGGATNKELSIITLRYGARIGDLRKEKHVIDSKRIGNDGLWRYILVKK